MLGGALLIALAATSWGTTGSVTTVLVADTGAGPLLIGAVRMWVAALLLLAGARLRGPLGLRPGDGGRAVALGAFLATFQACYFTAVTLSGIAVSALIAICSGPLFVAGLAPAVLGERLTSRTVLALGLGVLGTALLVAGSGAGPVPPDRLAPGTLLALVAGLAYALYVVVTKRALRATAPLPLSAVSFLAAAVLMTPALVWPAGAAARIAAGWPWLLYLGAVATAAAYACYATGLRRVPAATAAIISLLEPFTATVLGVAVFGERLGAAGAAGALLLLAAIGLLLAGRDTGRRGVRRRGRPGAGSPPG